MNDLLTNLGPDSVHVYWADETHAEASDLASGWQVLSQEERGRAERFVFPADRHRFIVAHALLRRTLSRYADVAPADWTFDVNAFGKPSIAAVHSVAALTFNMSHTDGLVACAAARTDVGIDVEAIDRKVQGLDIAHRFFSPPEVEWLSSQPEAMRPARFVELWTLKEAFVKGIGTGLSQPLNTFGFELPAEGVIRFQPPGDDTARWRFAMRAPTARHRLAVALAGPHQSPPVVSLFDERQMAPVREAGR